MLADSEVAYESILGRIKGVIFFGVPSQGMGIKDIHRMLKDQPNRAALIEDISRESEFLPNLEQQFNGISRVQNMHLFWAYETQTTPSVQLVNGRYERSGPEIIMVSPESATVKRCLSDTASTIQIDANHSEMVKFSPGSQLIQIIADKLLNILGNAQHVDLDQDSGNWMGNGLAAAASPNNTSITLSNLSAHDDPSQDSIRAPERDDRLAQIDERAGYSFEWGFNDPSIGLIDWLQKGDGIFWISGRPGSGKSTFMKFLHNDNRTSRLLRGWRRMSEHVQANFFFHYRGNLIQKSFEGLLRGILSQILEQAPKIFSIIHPDFQSRYQKLVEAQSLGSLQADITNLIIENSLQDAPGMHTKVRTILKSEIPHSRNGRATTILEESDTIEDQLLDLMDLSSRYRQEGRKHWTQHEITFMKGVSNIMPRYRRREETRRLIQNESWALQRLERALNQIISQRSIDLDLCIFIDALDEHDGPPEFIAEFLRDLIANQDSRTRVKVLFSSRPWDAFIKVFSGCPGFAIHEHTENDIRELCAYVIRPQTPGSQELLPLVDEIVERARGVFLWVKLVLRDLSKTAAEVSQSGNTQNLPDKLLATLQGLPKDLHEYYKTIIERIPQSYRLEAFCLIEAVAKGDTIVMENVPILMSCLKRSRHSQICADLRNYNYKKVWEIRLRTYTGGLIESHGRDGRLSLLHQTVVEFVQMPDFKDTVLGLRAHVMHDNGYTFYTKFFLCNSSLNGFTVDEAFIRQLAKAESTTGKSLRTFLLGSSPNFRVKFSNDTKTAAKVTALVKKASRSKSGFSEIGLAFLCHLRIFIDDAIELDSRVISRTSDPCLSAIMVSFIKDICQEEEAKLMVDTLANHGFRLERDMEGFTILLVEMGETGMIKSRYEPLVYHIMKRLPRLEIDLPLDGFQTAASVDLPVMHTGKMIHLSNYELTKHLLGRGANPNGMSSHKYTPLDVWVQRLYRFKYSLDERYRAIILLAQNGGYLRSTTKNQWQVIIHEFRINRLDVSPLKALKFPIWIDSEHNTQLKEDGTTTVGERMRRLFRSSKSEI
ncbi:hypothetical protein ACHAQJ_008607 [Trichoderma viride]